MKPISKKRRQKHADALMKKINELVVERKKKCPRCKKQTLEEEQVLNCLSKKDNKTYICQQCGNNEAAMKRKINNEYKF